MRAVCIKTCYAPGIEGNDAGLYMTPQIYSVEGSITGTSYTSWYVRNEYGGWAVSDKQFQQCFMLLDEE